MTKTKSKWYISLALVSAAAIGCGDSEGPTGDAVRGGTLYDEWWAVTGANAPPAGNHPLWASRPDSTTNTRTGPDTWRCKECHGWDYDGVAGAYGGGSHRTGIKGIRGTPTTASAIAALLSDPASHAYGGLLDDQDLADLGAFVTGSTRDTAMFIRGDGSFIGEAPAGRPAYARCAACHGDDGLIPPPGADADFEDFPGYIANDNPQEFLHKVRFGQPGTEMPPQANELSDDALAHLCAYVQTLPQRR